MIDLTKQLLTNDNFRTKVIQANEAELMNIFGIKLSAAKELKYQAFTIQLEKEVKG
jgi:hypothetical protein